MAQVPAADEMLQKDPFALLVGMLLDQQIPLEKAFMGPYVLAERMGVKKLSAAAIADYDTEQFGKIFATVPAIHRFPGAMADRTQKLARVITDEYDGDASKVWKGIDDAKVLLKRIGDLPGFGKQKAQIFLALLGKQFGIQPQGWREVSGVFGEEGSLRSVADIVDKSTLEQVRQYKKQMKADAKAAGS